MSIITHPEQYKFVKILTTCLPNLKTNTCYEIIGFKTIISLSTDKSNYYFSIRNDVGQKKWYNCKMATWFNFMRQSDDVINSKSIIKSLDLTPLQVEQIVLEWYTTGHCDFILQTECGSDLEEILEDSIECYQQ